MPVSAPTPVAPVAELLKLGALPLPATGKVPPPPPRPPDLVEFAPPPTLETLRQLALSGQSQLATLLPALARTIHTDPAPLPLGHLARSLGDAAHQIDTGIARLLAGDLGQSAETTPAWRQATRTVLHETAAQLGRAERQLDALPTTPAHPNPDLLWAAGQIAGAQRQIRLALGTLAVEPRARLSPPPARRDPPLLSAAAAVFGMVLLLLLYALACGMWLIVAGLAGGAISLAIALVWGWRVVVASRSLHLEVRR